tara:strand:+ start:377 stop:745 length:369 start_codon:yes stop_codon:yes gene_type:complete
MVDYVMYILIGVLAGIFMGMIGMGAGIITVPLLIYTGMGLHNAVGASLLMQLLPQSLPGVLLYHHKGYINYRDSILVILGSLVGIGIGSYLIVTEYITEKMAYKILTYMMIIITCVFSYKYL